MKNRFIFIIALLVSASAQAEKSYSVQESDAMVIMNTLQQGLARTKAQVAPNILFVVNLKCVSVTPSAQCTLINHDNARVTLSPGDSSVLFEVLAGLKTRTLIGPRADKREPLLDRTDISASSETIAAILLTCETKVDGTTGCQIAQD